MQKNLYKFIAFIPLLLSAKLAANPAPIFEIKNLELDHYNSRSISYKITDKGYRISAVEGFVGDPFIRFKNINNTHEVSIKDNQYIAIRYRSNYVPQYALRILSTARPNEQWSDFHFPSAYETVIDSPGQWHTSVFELSFAHSRGTTEESYASWAQGNYRGLSFNITSSDITNADSYLYLSSFAFFDNVGDASAFLGLDYSSEGDTVGPVITIPYGDGETYTTTAGKKISLIADYYDEYDDYYGKCEGDLSEAVDENGLLVKGDYSIEFQASDLSGNISKKYLNLIVEDKDVEAPVINLEADVIYVLTNTYNNLHITAYDEVDGEIECAILGLEEAVNEKGQFKEGVYPVTITASDLTGNTATESLTINVGNDINPNNKTFIDEGE